MSNRKPLKFDPVAEARAHWVASGWEDAAPGMALVTSVMRVQQVFLAQVDEVLAPHGLTFARYELLMLLTFTRKGELPLGKISERPPRVGVVDDGWPSVTWVQRLRSTWQMPDGLALLECTLGTGRLHQIRAHLLAAGWPVAGDPIYRSVKAESKLPAMTRVQVDALQGQALHAWRLTMPHPMTGEILDVTAPVPARLQALGVNPGGSWDATAGRARSAATPHA